MKNKSASQIEHDLIEGDELLKSIDKADLKISELTKKQLIGNLRTLQKQYKMYSTMNPEKQLIIAPLCFLLGIFCLISVSPSDIFAVWGGIFLVMEPFIYFAVYWSSRSGSQKYLSKIATIKKAF